MSEPAEAAETTGIPPGLGPAGRRLWVETVDRWQCDPDELILLEQACALVDELVLLRRELVKLPVTVTGSRGHQAEPAVADRHRAPPDAQVSPGRAADTEQGARAGAAETGRGLVGGAEPGHGPLGEEPSWWLTAVS